MTDNRRNTGTPELQISGRSPDIRDFAVYSLLLLGTLVVYGQVHDYGFVGLDDPEYVSSNPYVHRGLTLDNLAWAFTSNRDGNWFPLTWLSHMADYRFFGARSGLHHLTSVLLHAFSTLLLFAFLKRMTGFRWRSAVVAALFALHPLHVESVAWVAERKDVLSGLFWMLSLWGYARYIERPGIGRYLFVVAAFCLGLMSKPMIITLPCVLLLLDVWPLRRIALRESVAVRGPKQKARPAAVPNRNVARVFWEKIPLFALSACSAVVTFIVQQKGGAVVPVGWIPLDLRVENALVSYGAYLVQTFWPERLVVFYPHPLSLPAWQIFLAGLVLLAISILALRSLRRFPYVAVGWFWYLGTLIPVIGLVQVGLQARADRYTYIPLIGIFLLVTWGTADVFQRLMPARSALAGMSVAACSACLILTWHQVQYWKNSASLFSHAVEASSGNYLGYYGLGGVMREQGKLDEAVTFYSEAVRLFPSYAGAHGGLGAVYLKQGRLEEAISELSIAISQASNQPEDRINEDRINMGIALNRVGKPDEAIVQLMEAIRLDPDSSNAHYNLGTVYAGMGKTDDALAQFAKAVELEPDSPEAHFNLGTANAGLGKMNEAIAEFKEAIRLRPDYGNAHNNLGSALASLGRFDEAITHFTEAVRLMPDSQDARRNLEYAITLRDKSAKK